MNDFKLPIITEPQIPPKVLTMDEYLEFVDFNLQNTFDRAAYEKWKELLSVNVRFSLE
ncbi:MAG: hypothetical protein IT366_20295 [Candidatus Hydrogenedentes bacterium]|nr:hypothetical protein [Candidatus Hydrogenedentota bacterium]